MQVNENYKSEGCYRKLGEALIGLIDANTIIVGLGTDAFIFDALGPLTATLLKERHITANVFGTLQKTINYKNLKESIAEIKRNYPSNTILVIDACFGEAHSIGNIIIKDSGGNPGAGVKKKYEAVGDVLIAGIVEDKDEYQVLVKGERMVRLGFVMELAKVIADAIWYAINSKGISNERAAI